MLLSLRYEVAEGETEGVYTVKVYAIKPAEGESPATEYECGTVEIDTRKVVAEGTVVIPELKFTESGANFTASGYETSYKIYDNGTAEFGENEASFYSPELQMIFQLSGVSETDAKIAATMLLSLRYEVVEGETEGIYTVKVYAIKPAEGESPAVEYLCATVEVDTNQSENEDVPAQTPEVDDAQKPEDDTNPENDTDSEDSSEESDI